MNISRVEKVVLIGFLAGLMSLTACSNEGRTPASGASPRPAEERPSASGTAGAQQTTGTLMARILPESPTAKTDLQVTHSATGKAVYQWKRNGVLITGENTGRLTKDQFVKGDTITAVVVAEGSEGSVSLVIGNSPPEVTAVAFSPDTVYPGTDITVKTTGFDLDGDEVMFHYKWTVNGNEIFEDSPVLAKDRFKRGDVLTLRIIPYDRDGEGTPFVFRDMVIPNAPPRITSTPPQNFAGYVFTYQVVAEDSDKDPVSFSLSSAPPGMNIDSKTGLITWQINEKSAGAHVIEVVAQDPQGQKAVQKFSLTINLPEGGAK